MTGAIKNTSADRGNFAKLDALRLCENAVLFVVDVLYLNQSYPQHNRHQHETESCYIDAYLAFPCFQRCLTSGAPKRFAPSISETSM